MVKREQHRRRVSGWRMRNLYTVCVGPVIFRDRGKVAELPT